jgi:hypothetical protein
MALQSLQTVRRHILNHCRRKLLTFCMLACANLLHHVPCRQRELLWRTLVWQQSTAVQISDPFAQRPATEWLPIVPLN